MWVTTSTLIVRSETIIDRPVVMDIEMLTPTQMDILVDLLIHGDNTASNMAENIEWSRNSIQKSFGGLENENLVEKKGSGVRTLTYPGAQTARAIIRAREQDIDPENIEVNNDDLD